MHAADEKHTSIFVFLNGAKGAEAFQTLEQRLPPDPKIPYENIIKNMVLGDDSSVMQAIRQIPDGSKIFIPIAAGASPSGVTALIQNAVNLEKGYDVHFLVNGISETSLQKAAAIPGKKFRMHALFLGGNMRKLAAQGKVNYIPGYLSDFNRLVPMASG
jgi:acyl-CoA hydrolase